MRLDELADLRPPAAAALERTLDAHVVAYRADARPGLVQMCQVAAPADLTPAQLRRLREAEPPGIILVAYAKPLRRSGGSLCSWPSARHP